MFLEVSSPNGNSPGVTHTTMITLQTHPEVADCVTPRAPGTLNFLNVWSLYDYINCENLEFEELLKMLYFQTHI